jgi:hypothetical protein
MPQSLEMGSLSRTLREPKGSLFLLAARARSLRAENSIIPPGWSFVKRKIAQILKF